MKVSVVIPCYRSSDSLVPLVQQLHEALEGAVDAYEVILVVDGSPDQTYSVAKALQEQRPDVLRTVLLRRNYGQHNALLAGIARAQFPVTVTMDDDLQHRPDQIALLLAPLREPGVDLVYGVGEAEEHGFLRSAASRLVKRGLVISGVPNAGVSGAFRAFRTELREAFVDHADPYVSIDVVLSWATTAVADVPVRMDLRTTGTSGYTLSALVRHAWNMITGYGTLPLRLVSWLGLLSSLLGLVMLVTVVSLHWAGRIEVAGFTTLVSLMSLFSGAMMLAVGVLGEYLGRLHFRSMQKPTYLVRSDSLRPGPAPQVVTPADERDEVLDR